MVELKGAKMLTQTIQVDISDQEDDLRQIYKADVIVNATGLEATELADDTSCYSIRGALQRIISAGKDFPKRDHALTLTADAAHTTGEIVFIVPRSDDILLIGGVAEP